MSRHGGLKFKALLLKRVRFMAILSRYRQNVRCDPQSKICYPIQGSLNHLLPVAPSSLQQELLILTLLCLS
jgi:hypothetical protein